MRRWFKHHLITFTFVGDEYLTIKVATILPVTTTATTTATIVATTIAIPTPQVN
jgi:hypothetical protein